jgi:DNA-binding transcriptional MerR regulator
MRIGELAQLAGVSADTIRYYERLGLMPSPRRMANGYREYPDAAGSRLRVIRNAVQLGFPLEEIAKVLRIRDAGGAPCRQVRDYAQTLVAEIDQRMAQLQSEKTAMLRMITNWNAMLETTHIGSPARLLEHGEIAVRGPVVRSSRLRRQRPSRGGGSVR